MGRRRGTEEKKEVREGKEFNEKRVEGEKGTAGLGGKMRSGKSS